MKKTYIAPELDVQLIQLESLVALSFKDGEADPDGEVLIKEDRGEDIWGSSKNVWDDDWSK
jgi:hypothetical protein